MNQARRKRRQAKTKAFDLWQPVAPLPPLEPVVPATDPTALLRSLGEPPLHGQEAQSYLALAVARAAMLATALATAAGVRGDAQLESTIYG